MKTYQQQRTDRGQKILQVLALRKEAQAPEATNLQKEINQAIESGNFENAFIPLKKLRDYYRGIHTSYETKLCDQPALIRDARLQKEKYICKASYYKYVQLGLNYLNGIIDLLEIENENQVANKKFDIESLKKQLIQYTQQYYQDITPEDPDNKDQQFKAERAAERKFGRFFHEVIIPFYHQCRLQYKPELKDKNLKNDLALARNFANMKVSPHAIVTISRIPIVSKLQKQNQKTIDSVEIDLPMLELTKKQKTLYRNRAIETWYKNQSDIAKKLIDRYQEKIVNAAAMIPSRLINHLIGARHAYENWTVVLNKNTEEEALVPTIINKNYHAGTPAHHLELFDTEDILTKSGTDTQATQTTIEQYIELTSCENLSVNTLLTPLSVNKDDYFVTQIKTSVRELTNNNRHLAEQQVNTLKTTPEKGTPPRKARSKNTNISLSIIPQNIGRTLGRRNIKDFKELCEVVNELLNKSAISVVNTETAADSDSANVQLLPTYFSLVKDYLNNSQTSKPAPHILALYRSYNAFKKALKHSSTLIDPHNNNLKIIVAAHLLIHDLNQFLNIENKTDDVIYYALVSGCESGQDRQGAVNTETTNTALLNHIMAEETIAKKIRQSQLKNIRNTTARSGQTHTRAGDVGGGLGGEGIKPQSSPALPHSFSRIARKELTDPTARYNERFPKNPTRSFYKKKSFWIGAGLAVAAIALCATGILLIKGIVTLTFASAFLNQAIASAGIFTSVSFLVAAIKNYYHAHHKRLPKSPYNKPAPQLINNKPKSITSNTTNNERLTTKSRPKQKTKKSRMSKPHFQRSIVLFGKKGVGKTSFLNCIYGIEFKENIPSTSSADYYVKHITKNTSISKCTPLISKRKRIPIWDTSGSATSYEAHKKTNKPVLFVDLSTEKTRTDSIKYFEKYLIDKNGNKIAFSRSAKPYVVFTKKDKAEDNDMMPNEDKLKQIATNAAQAAGFKKSKSIHYVVTSSKTGFNVNEKTLEAIYKRKAVATKEPDSGNDSQASFSMYSLFSCCGKRNQKASQEPATQTTTLASFAKT